MSSSRPAPNQSTSPTPSKDQHITIIGAGLFGLTTALELARRGYRHILVLDRFVPPVPDGSSVDLSRVIRPDYADEFYAKIGMEAMQGWSGEYAEFFKRSGLLCISQGEGAHPYLESSRANLKKMGMRVQNLKGRDQIQQRYPAMRGDFAQAKGYFNPVCGWADAQQSINYLVRRCSQAGLSFVTGSEGTVTELVRDGGRVIGVRTGSGSMIRSDWVIVATGAWTPHLLDMTNLAISTGQPVGFMQLTAEEAQALRDYPVVIDLSTGWFAFPPTPDTNILKMARHGYGYETSRPSSQLKNSVSVPKLTASNVGSKFIPKDAEAALRDGLSFFFPQFKDREFMNRRLCWYTDTPQGDFIVDHHPHLKNLFVAAGGSGHAFKFLPVLGRYVADSFENKAPESQRRKWAWKTSSVPISKGDGSRGGPPRRLLRREEQARL